MNEININTVFIGSYQWKNRRSKKSSRNIDGKKIDSSVKAFVVPGSGLVKKQAENEGLDKIFLSSGFEWRDPMCLAMNSDKLRPTERCASTSNRNFEGRQGRGGRTHLARKWQGQRSRENYLMLENYRMENL